MRIEPPTERIARKDCEENSSDEMFGIRLAQRPLDTADRGGNHDGGHQPNADF